MEAVGAAASIIAVIELSAKVASICAQYCSAVKSAKADIERLQGELGILKITLDGARTLLEGPNGARLRTSQGIRNGLNGCYTQLVGLETKLETKVSPGLGRKAMKRFGFRALKWPYERTDVDGIIQSFERYRSTLNTALIIDEKYVAGLALGSPS